MERQPSSEATAHHFYAMNLMCRERWNDASTELERARELDPLSVIINGDIGLVYHYARQPDRALEAEGKALELDPTVPFIYEIKGMAYVQKKMYSEAIIQFQKALDLDKGFPQFQAELVYTYAAEGNKVRAGRILADLESQSRRHYVSPTAWRWLTLD
jgi:tetratricopeptide (TPR) repeat protein